MDSSISNLVDQTAPPFQVDPKWIKAIIEQESQGNCYALRYEPKYLYLFQPQIFAKHFLISLDTETATQKMSWGLGQIMGAIARSQGHTGFMGELFKPDLNIKHMCILIRNLKSISPEKDDIFAMYNGGGRAKNKVNDQYPNQAYVDSVNGYLQKS